MKYVVMRGQTPMELPDARSVRVLLEDGNHIELQIRDGEVRLHATAPMNLRLHSSNTATVAVEDR